MRNIVELVRLAREKGASDLHLVANVPLLLRIGSILESVDGENPLAPEDIANVLEQLTTPEQRWEFSKNLELCFATTLPGVGRIRCDVALQQGTISLSLRILEIPDIDTLELPQVCKELAMRESGLVIVCGPTGSGRTTTLAAMVNHINKNRRCFVVTIESPVEYFHTNLKSVVTHRNLGIDTPLSFATAAKQSLRQNPHVMLIGEVRDSATADAVLTIADSGHLVLTTSSASSVTGALDMIIDLLEIHQRYSAQIRLASVLVGVLHQLLVPRANGSGRIAVVEVLVATETARHFIRLGQFYQLPHMRHTSGEQGMVMFDQALATLYTTGTISAETVLSYCKNKDEIEKLIGKLPLD